MIWLVGRGVLLQQSLLADPTLKNLRTNEMSLQIKDGIAANQTEKLILLDAYGELSRQMIADASPAVVLTESQIITQEMAARGDGRRRFVAVAARRLATIR
jgi:hypothetical protein